MWSKFTTLRFLYSTIYQFVTSTFSGSFTELSTFSNFWSSESNSQLWFYILTDQFVLSIKILESISPTFSWFRFQFLSGIFFKFSFSNFFSLQILNFTRSNNNLITVGEGASLFITSCTLTRFLLFAVLLLFRIYHMVHNAWLPAVAGGRVCFVSWPLPAIGG